MMATLYEQLAEAYLMLEQLPHYVPQAVPGNGPYGLCLDFGGLSASPLGFSTWTHSETIVMTLTRSEMAAFLKERFRPTPRMIEVAVPDDVFQGQTGVVTPGAVLPGQTMAKLVEVLPE